MLKRSRNPDILGKHKIYHVLTIAALLLFISCMAQADILMVPAQYPTIQDGLNAALAGDTVLVSAGTYYEHIIWPNTYAIHLISEDGAEQTIIDGESTGRVIDFSTNIVLGWDTEIKGFTIQNGNAGNDKGGGILCEGSSPTITENIITLNHANGHGAGIYCGFGANALIKDNQITDNEGYYGVGIGLRFADPVIIGNVISGNSSWQGWASGIDCYDASPLIIGNTIMNNSCYYNGGAIYCTRSQSIIQFNDILNNTSTLYSTGGIYYYGLSDFSSIHYNNIVGNGYGVYKHGSGDSLNAKYNWWGYPSGPGGEGSGAGDWVGEGVIYTPWLQELAPQGPVVSLPATIYGPPGDTISIPVMVSELTELGVVSAGFDLIYNSDILTGIDADTSGTLLSGTDWTCEYNVVGDTFSVTLTGTDTLAGIGNLINLIFVISPDAEPWEESPLHFENFIFNEGIPMAIMEDGVFIVIPGEIGAIGGIVTSVENDPIEGAIVTAYNTFSYCDTTDVNGYYLISEVVIGTYNMTVTAFGYNDFDTTGIIVVADETTTVNFAMLHPEIIVEPTSFDIELPTDTTYSTTMTINNPGNGPLDFTISIGEGDRFIKSIDIHPVGLVLSDGVNPNEKWEIPRKKIPSDTGVSDFYGEFAMSPISGSLISVTQPSASSENGVPINRVWRTHRPAGEDTIHYDGDNFNGIGFTAGGTWEAAIRLTPAELVPYDGWRLISVLFYHWWSSTNYGQLKIYDTGSSSEPGALITSEPYSVNGLTWLRTDLSEPVTIDATQDLWTSVEITQTPGEYPLGCDAGPAVYGKGDFVYHISVGWTELYLVGINNNWNIRAIVAPKLLSVIPDSGAVPAGQSIDLIVYFDTHGLIPDSTYTTTILIHNNSAESLVEIPVTMHVGIVGVDDETPQGPSVFALSQNYPNPFSTSTTISFNLATKSHKNTQIKIYNLKGQLVKTLTPMTNDKCPMTSIVWDGKDENGKQLSNGIYLYRITAGDFTDTKKCVILK